MVRLGVLTVLLSLGAGALGATPFPASNFPYWGKVQIWGRDAARKGSLQRDVKEACRITHRALFAVENYWAEIREHIGDRGVNFPVLYRHREFYESRLRRRFTACTTGTLRLSLAGRCATSRDTLAYVRVPFGIVVPVINVCDEYFAAGEKERVDVIVHEFGRLEDIGDSTHFDRNNIYVWDAIVGRLGDPHTFSRLGELKQLP